MCHACTPSPTPHPSPLPQGERERIPLPSRERSCVRAGEGISIFEPGRNCWRVAPAKRVGFLIDAEHYFTALAHAALNAERSIYIAGWDFHSQTRLVAEPIGPDVPPLLGAFLNFLVSRRRGLRVHILIWDFPLVFGFDREWSPLYGLGWNPHHHIRLRFDNTHPTGGSHHQKIVVIDNSLAFCGGIDLTCRRWDTSAHAPDDERRLVGTTPYPPMHDVMMAVDDGAAESLGELFRERWQRATGDEIQAEGTRRQRWRRWRARRAARDPVAEDLWPRELEVNASRCDVAIARTRAPRPGEQGIHEIEALYLDMIAAARKCIYIENQYFTADKVAAALAVRLEEADGPEIVIVLRELSHGWLEEMTMQTLRTKLVERLRASDRHQRLRVYTPHIAGLTPGTCIDVHAKLMIVDDFWARIGSANLANRSMGLDTECDLTIEARDREDLVAAIAKLRTQLVAEHLGVEPELVSQTVAQEGSLGKAIDRLHSAPRTLEPLTSSATISDAVLSVISVADPERPIALEELTEIFVPEGADEPRRRHPWRNLGIVALVLLVLAALWQYTPLGSWAAPSHIHEWARAAGHNPWVAVLVVLAYLPASLVMFPRPLITLFAVLAFGPYIGFALAFGGVLLAAAVPYFAGRRLDRSFVRRIAGSKLDPIVKALRRKGLWAVTALRLVPIAPFVIANVVAGTIRIRPRDYIVGSALGMLPGTLVSTIFSGQLRAGLEDVSNINFTALLALVVAFGAGIWAIRRWVLTPNARTGPSSPHAR